MLVCICCHKAICRLSSGIDVYQVKALLWGSRLGLFVKLKMCPPKSVNNLLVLHGLASKFLGSVPWLCSLIGSVG